MRIARLGLIFDQDGARLLEFAVGDRCERGLAQLWLIDEMHETVTAPNQFEDVEDELLAVNAREVEAYEESGPGRDRLTLNHARVRAMASALREIADAPDPLFEVLDRDVRPNGLHVERLRVPLGVIGVVYENRPNVTSDVAGLCIRSGNAAYLRGSSSAMATMKNSPWRDTISTCRGQIR